MSRTTTADHKAKEAMPVHLLKLVVTAAILVMGDAWAMDNASFKITAKRDTDRVEVSFDNGKTVIAVHSPFGISQASIERTREVWPDPVMLRLHLQGLESLKVTTGNLTLAATVSSQDVKLRFWKNGEEDSPLDSKHPYWMEIQVVGTDADAAKTIPLKNGYFEMRLPQALLADNSKSITLSWIDFYR